MNKTLIPARVTTPGRILQREIDDRGWTQKDLAVIMSRPPQAINEIIRGTKQITPETARELAAALGTSAEFWTNLETNYRLRLTQKKPKEAEIERRSRLYTLAPISELTKRGWIQSAESIDELEQSVCEFLGIKSLQETPQISVNFRHSQILEPEHSNKIAWCKRVEQVVSNQKVNDFDLNKSKKAIPELLKYAEKEENVAFIPQLLLDLGIHFTIVPHLKKTYLDGAVFYLKNNPVIALTLRHDRIDCFWFSLMHELGHIVAGHEGVYLDNLENLAKNPQEEEADLLARSWLIDKLELDSFVRNTKPRFSKQKIIEFAYSQHRHPGIILGRLQYDKLVSYKNLRQLLVKVKPLLSDWIDE